jgi:hypothetical protein
MLRPFHLGLFSSCCLFGMGQSKANQWIHVLLPVLLAALRTLGDAPARSLTALVQRLGVSDTFHRI